jgi:hypothetical protein
MGSSWTPWDKSRSQSTPETESARRNKLVDEFIEAQYNLLREADEKIIQNIKDLHSKECNNPEEDKCAEFFMDALLLEIKMKIVKEMKKKDPRARPFLN